MSFLEHLTPSDETEMIRDTARRWAAGITEAAISDSDGFDAARWADMAAMGWHGVLLAEQAGGLGLAVPEAALLCETAGRARLPEPFAASSIICVGALGRLDAGAALLAGSSQDQIIAAPVGFGLPCDGRATPLSIDSEMILSGTAALCEAGPETGLFIVLAWGPKPVIAALDRDTKGLTVTPFRAIDGRHLCRIDFTGCHVPADRVLATGETALQASRYGDALAVVALAADALGCMERATALTTTYLNEREQFGSRLASFQALQHMVADMTVELEMCRSMVELATFATQSLDDPVDLLDRVRARVCRAAQMVGQTTIQLHGGMGMTNELAIGHYFRRLIYIQAMMGQEAGALRDRAHSIAEEIAAEAQAAR